MGEVTPEMLYEYANGFRKRAEAAGRGSEFPTFRRCAKRFNATLDEIEDACAGWEGDGYMAPAVGFGIPGFGAAEIRRRGDYLVEAYDG